ncbi:hypothetical protein [Qipengyuania soli]|uniref:ParB/Sulfiredoxin domain-containing protein n=1 Tax=Qipengyuania soli TaxID=2782568 RepID=A0A7S8F6T2_9SPHN|nr:hypothetical protein [Qipengyuania soli]QPD00213.1 hypothetical protein IRL76_06725 [Qipengyuania soli]
MASWDRYFGGGQRGKVPVDELHFDRNNPRFTPDKQPKSNTDVAIIEYLDRTADLGELVQSIAASGYVDIEPLIVIDRNDELIVLEGNRRLGALKVLRDPKIAEASNVAVPELSDEIKKTLQEVSAFLVHHEDEARNLIGFKHINGPQGWDAYAKALYASNWLDDELKKGDGGLSLTDIAARMGDKHDTLYRIVSAIYVLQQAEAAEIFRVEDRVKKNFHFSHLYTALTYSEYRDFLGLDKADRTANPPKNPVPPENLDRLQRILVWLYGKKSENRQPAIRTQAPDLSNLKKVLGNQVARRIMMERNDLFEALQMTVEGGDRFSKALVDAQSSLRTAVTEVVNADDDEETISIAEDVRTRANFILRSLIAHKAASSE